MTAIDWEPGATGPAGTPPHPDPGPEPVHVPRQVPLHAQREGGVHQPEQDPQPARVRGRDRPQVPQHQVSCGYFQLSFSLFTFAKVVIWRLYAMICVFEGF